MQQPVIDSPLLQRSLGVADMTALRAIDDLVSAGVLSRTGRNYRNRKWSAPEVLAALDAFAARGGRRALRRSCHLLEARWVDLATRRVQ